jgi:putative Ca2+/H+ antiporter (TMEM165/GDT1 family)
LEIFFISMLTVALAEIGDKTQLLAIVLTTKFRQPVAIILGIFLATVANHALAALGGYYLADFLAGQWFQYLIAALFILMAFWTLIPDKEAEGERGPGRTGAFLTTLVAFFLIEIGDKTQIATVALAARFHAIVLVAAGTTLGMLLADVPAVLLADRATNLLPLKYIRVGAAILFFVLGCWALVEVWSG